MSSAASVPTRVYSMGRLRFSLAGHDPILPYLESEMQPLSAMGGAENARVQFVFTPELPALHEPVLMSPVSVGADALVTSHGGLTYHTVRQRTGPEGASALRLTLFDGALRARLAAPHGQLEVPPAVGEGREELHVQHL